MKLSILALAAMIVVAGAADSRRLLQNPLDLLVGGKEFPKLGKNDKSPSPPPPAPGRQLPHTHQWPAVIIAQRED